MAKYKKHTPGKLLEHWEAPDDAGCAIGMISTTFTFQADFFEEQCLSRFLQMENDALEEGGLYLLEQEEKLQALQCVSVWVDQTYAKQKRNLRWDLIPFRFHSAILHSKITCLLWANHARIILGSANLSTDGYRRNQELMIVLDWNLTTPGDRNIGVILIDFLSDLLGKHQQPDLLVSKRSKDFLISFKSKIRKWGTDPKSFKQQGYKLFPLLTNPFMPSLLDQAKRIWKQEASSTLPDSCFITSPFFDQVPSSNNACLHIRDTLRSKGEVSLQYLTTGEFDRNNNSVQLIHLPSFIRDQKQIGNVELTVQCIQENVKHEGALLVNRPLHAKSIWWESSEGWIFYVIGSSNFTAKGLGISKTSNYEGNIGIMTHRFRYKNEYKRLDDSFIRGVEVDLNSVICQALPPEDENSTELVFTPLHPFFISATLFKTTSLYLRLCFRNHSAPHQFEIKLELGETLFNNTQWEELGSPLETLLPFSDNDGFPVGFNVSWDNNNKTAWLTLNIEAQDVLPLPEELKDLSLDVLTRVLTSAKPLHKVWKLLLKKQQRKEVTIIQEDLDPHQRVSTSSFLLKRIKKYSLAIDQLRNQLELPVPTIQSLEWRLHGPIGLMAFWKALQKEARSMDEEIFFLSEIVLMLQNINLQTSPNYLSIKTVSKEINEIKSILKTILKEKIKGPACTSMKMYSKKVIEKCNN